MAEVKISGLPIANTVSETDRLVVLANPGANASVKTVTVGTIGELFANASSQANTGDITFNGIQIIGSNSTIELVPNTELRSVDQYLVIEALEEDTIVRVRTGSNSENSQSELQFGSNTTYTKIIDGVGVALRSNFTSDDLQFFQSPDVTDITWFSNSSGNYVSFNDGTGSNLLNSSFWQFTDGENDVLFLYSDTTTASVTYANWGQFDGGVYTVRVQEEPEETTSFTTLEFQLFTTETNSVELEDGDININAVDELQAFATNGIGLYSLSNSSPVTIIASYNENQQSWRFQPSGIFEAPGAIATRLGTSQEYSPFIEDTQGVIDYRSDLYRVFEQNENPTANWTVNLINFDMSFLHVTEVTLVVKQGASAFIPSALQINGESQNFTWKNNTPPAGTPNRTDFFTFKIFNYNGYTVYADHSSY